MIQAFSGDLNNKALPFTEGNHNIQSELYPLSLPLPYLIPFCIVSHFEIKPQLELYYFY